MNFGQVLTIKPVKICAQIKNSKLQEAVQKEIQFINKYDYSTFNVDCPVEQMKSFRRERTLHELQTDICILNLFK